MGTRDTADVNQLLWKFIVEVEARPDQALTIAELAELVVTMKDKPPEPELDARLHRLIEAARGR